MRIQCMLSLTLCHVYIYIYIYIHNMPACIMMYEYVSALVGIEVHFHAEQ